MQRKVVQRRAWPEWCPASSTRTSTSGTRSPRPGRRPGSRVSSGRRPTRHESCCRGSRPRDRELVLTPRHVGTPYLPDTYAVDVAGGRRRSASPVEAAVHVQAGWQGPDAVDETRWLETLPFGENGAPRLAGIVAHADPRDPDIGRVLDEHRAASTRVGGHSAHHRLARRPQGEGLGRQRRGAGVPEFLRGFAALAERGLTFDAWVYAGQLGRSPARVGVPGDHDRAGPLRDAGRPAGPMGEATGRDERSRADLLHRWRDDIAAVASHPNVVAKQSGIAFPPLGTAASASGGPSSPSWPPR